MILSPGQAKELGEALLDAVENLATTGKNQQVLMVNEGSNAVSMPLELAGCIASHEIMAVVVSVL